MFAIGFRTAGDGFAAKAVQLAPASMVTDMINPALSFQILG